MVTPNLVLLAWNCPALSIFVLSTPSLIVRSEILRQACYGKNFILNLLRRAVQNDSAFAGGGAINVELST